MAARPEVSDYYEELNNDRDFRSQLQKMEDDAKKAVKDWETQKSGKGKEGFPSDFLAEYEKLGGDLDDQQAEFEALYRKGEAAPNKLVAAFNDYWESLQLLQAGNAQAEALLEVDVKTEAAQKTQVCVELAKLGRSQILSSLRQQLKELKKKLEDAQKEQETQPLKAILKGLVDVCAVALLAVEGFPVLAVAAGAVTLSVAIDYMHGDSGAKSALGNTAKAADQIVEMDDAHKEFLKEAGSGGSKFLGAAAKILDLANDAAEGIAANQAVERLQGLIASTQDTYKSFLSEANPISQELRGLQKQLDSRYQEVKKAMTKSSDAAKKYKTIQDKLKG